MITDIETTILSCSVCLEDIENDSKYVLVCKHSFHEECIMQWIRRCNTCPLCRSEIVVGRTVSNDDTISFVSENETQELSDVLVYEEELSDISDDEQFPTRSYAFASLVSEQNFGDVDWIEITSSLYLDDEMMSGILHGYYFYSHSITDEQFRQILTNFVSFQHPTLDFFLENSHIFSENNVF